MSERSGSFIRASREFYGGIARVGAFAPWVLHDLGGMRRFAFEPATSPVMLARVLKARCAALASSMGLFVADPDGDRRHPRGPFFLTLPVLTFAASLRSFVRAISSLLSICATAEARTADTIIRGWC